MTNPLTTLDELIWKQFEKVTIAANKKWGWDKWDLAMTTDYLYCAGFACSGVYVALYGVFAREPSIALLGAAGAAISPLGYSIQKEKNRYFKNREWKQLVETGATAEPV
jgi:hypothetical protein